MTIRKQAKRNGRLTQAEIDRLGRAYLEGRDMSNTHVVRSMAEAYADKVQRDFRKLQKKIRIEFTDRDPYRTFEELANDVMVNKRMYVFTGFSDTPLWSPEVNWMARAVHDYDHVAANTDFSIPGELAAYQYAVGQTPLLEPLILSEVALQAASTQVLGGQFAAGSQKVVLPEYEIVKLARQATKNPGKRARKEAAHMVWDMAAALQYMPKEDAMALLAAAGVPFEDALVVLQAGETVEQAA
ncbi:MAG: hypothetical protein EBT03_11395 [Betaproteobacteria bacterium]|nr:hypothetical protein [Betaproteobacteria bacterium]